MATFGQHQNASLYVGDLAPDVTESVLFDLFKAVGPVLSIRVCRDAVTRRSLGYAYVNFQNPNDAERALETLNYHTLKGTPIRIMWSQRDPQARKSGAGNVYIRNLEGSIDNQTLYDTFSQFGNILSCKVATEPSGESRGYGFVHFESEESAKAAIEKVNNMLLKGRQVFVGPFIRRTQRLAEEISRYTNVYIKDFKPSVTAEQLVNYFQTFGEIKPTAFALKTDKKGRPFAFVDYVEHDSAAKAVAAAHGTSLPDFTDGDQKIYVQRAQKKSERMDELRKRFAQMKARRANDVAGSNVYIKNLDDSVTDKELREAFQRFGEIGSAKVMLDEKDPPQSKGFAFVCFKDAESANKAIAEMNGFILGTKPLYVNVAQRKEVRRAHLEIQYAARMGGRLPVPPNPVMRGYPGGMPYFPHAQGFMPFPRMPMGGKWGPLPYPPPAGAAGMPRGGRFGAAAPRPFPKRGGRAGAPFPAGYPVPAARPAPSAAIVPPTQAPIGYPAAVVAPPAADQPLTAAVLAQMTPEHQKNALGERLFARITPQHPDHAAKITGMLLEMDVTEQLNMLESPDLLQAKVNEALEVLKAHGTQ
eukprot:TRINITY_DN1131_c0_g1_i1.p1 TRINITY_DN1131_c0_g1~~TRINITY_DN1131_c0_g1_i1.p1  ORF type:complete len:587 (+),score=118.04 TRINITY_DN1131_c0_g1_i1:46-1806(+)